jgi:hypothetical protein
LLKTAADNTLQLKCQSTFKEKLIHYRVVDNLIREVFSMSRYNPGKNPVSLLSILLIIALFSSNAVPLFASNLSEAKKLREKCEKEIKVLEIAVMNFGDASDHENFKKGTKLIKLGKVKFIQSKYPAAIERYKKYLKLQFYLYESLAKKYSVRTTKVVDDIAEDLVDHVDNKKVEKYLRLASQNVNDGKSTMLNKHYKNSIGLFRNAKNYAIQSYKLVGKSIPGKYKKDMADIDGRIFK